MELQIYLIIVAIFFISLGSLVFVNRQLRSGKTFEEALAEKRQLTEKLYGSKKKNTTKKANTGKKNRDRKDSKQKKDAQQPSAVESDGKSDSGSENDLSASPHSNDGKAHVEFTEEEIIAPDTNTIQFKRQLSTGKINPQVRKSSTTKSPGSGILVNKSTTAAKPAPPANGNIETLNHFEKIHPKDDLEIKKQRDESVGRTTNKKDNKKGKPAKKDSSPATPSNAVEKVANIGNDAVDAHLTVPLEVVAASVVAAPKESPKNTANKEKVNKKKRNDAILIQQLVDAGVASSTSEAVNVNAIIQQLGRVELTRNEIQILIDFLLNKQQDTGSVIHSDWSDDPIHKLRNQLEEKDRLLAEEQKAMLAIQTKLRELRTELNAERAQASHLRNAHVEEMNALKSELSQAQQDRQLVVERTNHEKQALNKQLQLLQQKLFQEQNTQSQESTQQLQQLTDAHAQLSAELLNKNNIIQDMQEKFLQIRDEHLSKVNESEQKYQELVHKNEQEIAYLNGEVLRLRNECQRKDELEKLYAMKTYEFEQLESRLNEQNKQSNQIEDSSKVEIRNLQNALDSTKTELTLSRNELADSSKRIGDLNSQLSDLKSTYEAENSTVVQKYAKQIEELNGTIQTYRTTISEKEAKLNELQSKLENTAVDQREQELFKQITDYKEKNNTANASLSPSKITAPAPSNNNVELEHISRTKQVFERLFPNVPSSNVDYDAWLANVSSHIEQLQQQQQQSQQNHLKKRAAVASNNHQNGDDEDSDSEENVTGNGTHHHEQDNGKLSPSEELILQNAHLKSIVAETSEILTSLEKKACLQDAYWRGVVQLKDNEIRSLQQNSVASTT
ncbi:ribosome-binding protein 1 isoform X2 [Sitodiplosis mosellana]|uniref:ribosome-binding protein 1 isoform X2 n=1 Tax=Sitodiplosis mosellana TaxID=263140 RepID=UPI0024445151|nr:ribosome-binding protein 1 isoform X2 [Sitodiplosis mosellana]XP_055315752.1 ribosome-binding protein 1 isoform X2 [Sitodiplosis mosellana]XP_055315764.1 ribosome-binding protein 1 isoform X2 [Sitodiplosis mosellana]XP_055315775.1 ribosome-binding protein 1 isoform X2 [Sitodiplosis mosellana]